MQGARNSPRMDEDPVGPHHWVAGGPVGYKHRMRDGMGARGQDRGVARAVQQPLGTGIPQDAGIGPVTGCDKGERDMGWDGRLIAPSISPVGLQNQSPWRYRTSGLKIKSCSGPIKSFLRLYHLPLVSVSPTGTR